MRGLLDNAILLSSGLNPYPCALNELNWPEYNAIRNMMLELKKKEIEDQRRIWKAMTGG